MSLTVFLVHYEDTHMDQHTELNMTTIVGLCWLNSNYTDVAGFACARGLCGETCERMRARN